MKTARPHDLIDMQALRLGMFVHLDGGWMSHPFPRSSFRITTPAQLETIRSLGLAQVRWSPEQSEPEPEHVARVVEMPPVLAANDAGDVGPELLEAAADRETWNAAPGTFDPAAVSAAARSGAERKRRLDSQRQAQATCERQYSVAARACRQAMLLAPSQPREARAQVESLTGAIVAEMLGAQDLCIRMLTDGAGDKGSMHAINVGLISLLMGRCFGFGGDELLDLGVGAMLHDIGKLDLPQRMRHRDDNFTASESRVYEEHVELGLAQARRMGLSPGASLIIGQHHEHVDGSGFPGQLNSDRMTMGARIVALVNRYDNLCNPQHLAKALTPHESVSLLFAQSRSKFDTSILGTFIKMMGVYPPGSAVQLTDDRYGLVISVNSSRPLKPCVLVYDTDTPRDDALHVDLEAQPGLGIRRSVKSQQLPPPALAYLAPSARVAYFFEAASAVGERA
ncbi:MAG: DUF3391 domain-containing protein [Pseudomonadota bacterium]|nr:DUF3391 domain-containing protein [Pseudomonadota bacterium]